MIIYDFSKDSSLFSFLFTLITIVCFVCLIMLVIFGIRTVMKNGISYHTFLLLIAVTIVMVLFVFLSYRTFGVMKYNLTCTSKNYELVSGPLEIVSITRDDYRDEELYTIDFIVDGHTFKGVVNSFSAEQKKQLTTLDKDIEVRYSYIRDDLVIYQIVEKKTGDGSLS